MKFNGLCIIGNSKPPQDGPIANKYIFFFITYIVDEDSGTILDAESSTVLPLTNEFIKKLFIGESIAEVDDDLLNRIRRQYLGNAQKAIQAAYKDAVRRYQMWKENKYE